MDRRHRPRPRAPEAADVTHTPLDDFRSRMPAGPALMPRPRDIPDQAALDALVAAHPDPDAFCRAAYRAGADHVAGPDDLREADINYERVNYAVHEGRVVRAWLG